MDIHNIVEQIIKRYSFNSDLLKKAIYPEILPNDFGGRDIVFTFRLQHKTNVSRSMLLLSNSEQMGEQIAMHTLNDLMNALTIVGTTLQLQDYKEKLKLNRNEDLIFFRNMLLPENVIIANPRTEYMLKSYLFKEFRLR
jgi:hypothetical protein